MDKINLLALLKLMLKIRLVESTISDKYSEQEMRCPTHLSIGQELPAAILGTLIKSTDYSLSTHRCHAHYLCKGGDLNAMIAELYGKKTGCCKGKGGSMHLIDLNVNFMGTSAIVGNNIPTGTGLGHAAKLDKLQAISVVHLGDGAIEEGTFYESSRYALIHQLPVLYFCENNDFSVYSPAECRQPREKELYQVAEGIGMKAIKIGKEVGWEEACKKVKEGIDECREHSKPVFIEFETYRFVEHCGPNPDDHLEYRKSSDVKWWTKNDPLKILESHLNEDEKKEYTAMKVEIKGEVDRAFEFAINSDKPERHTAYQGIYASTEEY